MHGALATLGLVVALMTAASAFVVPGPSKIISGRPTRASTSQVIVMGRGDTRTTKGKRMRHSYGKCRPQKKREVVYFDGEVVVKAAPVARRWENIEYDESALPKPQAAVESESQEGEGAAVEEGVEEAEPVDVVAAAAAVPFVSTPESIAAKAAEAAEA